MVWPKSEEESAIWPAIGFRAPPSQCAETRSITVRLCLDVSVVGNRVEHRVAEPTAQSLITNLRAEMVPPVLREYNRAGGYFDESTVHIGSLCNSCGFPPACHRSKPQRHDSGIQRAYAEFAPA